MPELLAQSGPVFWVILGAGLAAFVVFIERSLHLHRARIRSEDFLVGIFNVLRRQNIVEALALCDEAPGPVAYLVKTAILHRNEDKAELRGAIGDANSAEISRMERRLVVVSTVAQIAPLLGLLGTVLAMIRFLLAMRAQAPLVQSADVMDAMLQAAVTTAAGLTVAIPCYVAFHLLVVKIDRIVLDMERAGSDVIAFLKGGEPLPVVERRGGRDARKRRV